MGFFKDLYFKYIIGAAKAGSNISNNNQLFEQKAEMLRQFTLNSKDKGISDVSLCEHEVIVTLTTYGKRLYDVYLAIESIMQGTIKPNRIVLWLAESMKDQILPITLQKQIKRGLEIEYTEDIRSYKKLIPALKKYPEAICVTIDDDVIYNYDILENLMNSYRLNTNCIHACRMHLIKTDTKGHPLPYNDWHFKKFNNYPSKYNFATGGGGVLYPPHSLHSHVLDSHIFTKISPFADDVWFYAMALLNGKYVKKCFTHNEEGEDYIQNENVQDVSLNAMNVAGNKNDDQIKAVFEHYGIYDILKSDSIK